MADNLTKQLIETVKNKVPLNGGLSIKGYPVMGTLSDMKNFKIEDGVLKLRYGTKRIATFKNKRFYFLKNFEFCDTEVLIGLDYQLCLHAFFENWEGYDFIVRDASIFHKNQMIWEQGNDSFPENNNYRGNNYWEAGRLFKNGTQFWAYENQKYIMFFNDYGEIRVIVKDGGFKMHATDREDQQNPWIEVDIKDATNRVFDVLPALKDDTRNVAPRITGEYRFARVNELGVISELTEPQYLQTSRSKFATRIDLQKFNSQNLNKVDETKSADGEHKYIYSDNNGDVKLAGNSWIKPSARPGKQREVPAMIIVLPNGGKYYESTGHIKTIGGSLEKYTAGPLNNTFSEQNIPKGIYLVFLDDYSMKTKTGEDEYSEQTSWEYWDDVAAGQGNEMPVNSFTTATDVSTQWRSGANYFFDANLASVRFPQYNVNQICQKTRKVHTLKYRNDNSQNLRIKTPMFNAYYWNLKVLSDFVFNTVCGEIPFIAYASEAESQMWAVRPRILTRKSCVDSAYSFNWEHHVIIPAFFATETTWYRLEDDEELYRESNEEHLTLSVDNQLPDESGDAVNVVIEGQGKIYVLDRFQIEQIESEDESIDRIICPSPELARAFQYESQQKTLPLVYEFSDFDTIKYKAMVSTSVTVGDSGEYIFDLSKQQLVSKNGAECFITNSSWLSIIDRFAIWNGDKILGISQRLFVDKNNPDVPVYINNNIDPENLLVRYSPVLSLEFMNQRSFRFELPLIRRAIRKPQFLCVSNNYVYEFEDNRLWYGSAYDFMLTGYAYLDGSLLKLIAYNEGVLACTTSGLYYVNKEVVQPVVNGRAIRADFAGETQVGGVVIAENKVYVVKTEITDSGARIETANLISEPINELVFNGTIKLTCNKRQLYLADDYNVYGFDTRAGIWNLRYNYNNKHIANIFILDNRLGVLFDNEVDAAAANAEIEPISPK